MEQVIQITFDGASWVHAPSKFASVRKYCPTLGYNESSATLCAIVKRSSGGDFALGQAALNYLLKGLDHGARKDGSPVLQAIVVLADVDGEQRFKVVKQWTAEEMRDRFNGIEPQPGKFGPYWWIKISDGDDVW